MSQTTLMILVQPKASREKLGPMHDGRLKIAVTAPAVDGAANEAVIETLARSLRVAKRNLTVISGQTSRRKTIGIDGMDAQVLSDWLAQVTAT